MRKGTLNGIAALGLSGLALAEGVDGADTAWMLVSTALVLLMTPALAFFYGGLVRSKNALNTMMMSFAALAFVGVGWALLGYTLAFGEGGPLLGGLGHLLLRGVGLEAQGTIPHVLFLAFQGTFAIITAALVSGALVERMRFPAYLAFLTLWGLFVYAPLAHWVWGGGFLGALGALDFAGGTVVHINAGIAGLVGCIMIGKRIGFGKEATPPHSLTMTMIGASLLWVGWFGFNAGSALEAGNFAALAFINTLLATAGAVVAWSLAEWILKGHASMLGAASGAVAGLVAITPAAGNVGLMGALAIGAIAAIVCLWGVTGLKRLLKADDSLDVFGVHGIGGIVGALLTGVFNTQALGGPGLVTDWVTASVGSNPIAVQVLTQAKAVGVTVVWSAVAAFIAFKIADLIVGLRVAEEAEREGLDTNEHNERAYTN